MSLNTTTVLEALPAGVIILTARGLVKECNPAAVALLGEPLIGEKWAAVIERSFAPQADDGHEVSLKDGRKLSVQTCSLENGPGQLVLLYDVTETRELQSKVARNERLSMMGRMVASLAHQIRTPLSAAMLYASHIGNPQMTPELLEKCSKKLLSRLNHLEQHVKDMLVFARGDCPLAERMTSVELLRDIQQAADHVLSEQSHAATAVFSGLDSARPLTIRWEHQGNGQALICNRETLIGGVMNLINNAIEALAGHPLPEITISLLVHEQNLFLSVVDNGAGFDEFTARRIKEAFYTTKAQGTGLGLAVVDGIARAHRGAFHITSPGKGLGATATLVLPLQPNQVRQIGTSAPVYHSPNNEQAVFAGGLAHV
jgi:two-component system sensor histidine kinase FlrB